MSTAVVAGVGACVGVGAVVLGDGVVGAAGVDGTGVDGATVVTGARLGPAADGDDTAFDDDVQPVKPTVVASAHAANTADQWVRA